MRRSDKKSIPPEGAHPSQRSRSRCPFVGCWREAPPAGVLELSVISLVPLWGQNTWVELARTHQQPLANQGTNRGTHPGEVPAARLKAEAHLCTAAYLRPHHGAGGFRTAAQVPPRDRGPLRNLRRYARAGRGGVAGAGA